jgi:hypothetical protein
MNVMGKMIRVRKLAVWQEEKRNDEGGKWTVQEGTRTRR